MLSWRPCVAVGALALLLTGCGANSAPPQDPSAPEASSETTDAAADQDGDTTDDADDDDGQMLPVYEDADTPEAVSGRDLMQQVDLLESLADTVNEGLRLPYDIPLQGTQCGEANDYWNPEEKAVILCYEDVDENVRLFRDAGDPDPEGVAVRLATAAFYHELGHMAVDLYDLPITGREEDVADQMAAFWLLSADENGDLDPDSVQALKDEARRYRLRAQEWGTPDDSDYADIHSLDQARMYNFECWVYGSDPDGNQDIVDSGLLPQERADWCEGEYDRLVKAWGTLLDDHMK
jgi:hypothetical protein